MPNRQRHRGKHPKDEALFALTEHSNLRNAGNHLQWLLSKGYSRNASTKLVGDHHGLRQRQRIAMTRSVCTETAALNRGKKMLDFIPKEREVFVDGFNILITIETLLSGGIILLGQDGAYRDLASIHGSYHRVEETIAALLLIGSFLGKNTLHWFFDRPVSNSGRIVKLVEELAVENNWAWKPALHNNPDQVLIESKACVLTTDALILDECREWLNLTGIILSEENNLSRQLPKPLVVSFLEGSN